MKETDRADALLEILVREISGLIDTAEPPTTLRACSRALGKHDRYLDRALRGDIYRPSYGDTWRLLELLGADPREFFLRTYPAGGALERRLIATQSGDVPGLDLRLVNREMLRRFPPPRAADVEAGARDRLKAYLRDKEIAQEDAGRRLFDAPDAVPDVLAGRTALLFERVFPLLGLVEVEAWRFFRDLYGPEDVALTPEISWSDLLERLDVLDRDNVRKLAAEREERGLHPPLGKEWLGEDG